MTVAIVLAVGSKSLEAVPGAGTHLSAIFAGFGTLTFGASVTGVVLGLYRRTVGELISRPAA